MKKLRFYKGSKLFSVTLILFSGLIAAGLLWGANMYYDIDTGKIIVEEVQNVISAVTPQFMVAYDTALTNYLQISVADIGKTTIVTSHGLDINATGTSIWETTAGNLTIRATTTGSNVYLAAANILDLDAVTFNLDGTSAVNIGATSPSTTTINTVTFYIDATGDIRATSTKSIYLTAEKDFYITFDADDLFSLKRGTIEYLGIAGTGLTLGDDSATTTIDGSLITLSGNTYATGTLTVGADASGYTVTFYGDEAGKKMVWDDASSTLVITGAAAANANALEIASGDALIKGKVTVGQTNAGYNVLFYGSSDGAKMEWATSTNKLIVTGVSDSEALRIAQGNAVIAAGSLAITTTSTQAVTALTVTQSTTNQKIVEFKDTGGNTVFSVDLSGNIVIAGSKIESTTGLTIQSGGGGDLILDSASGYIYGGPGWTDIIRARRFEATGTDATVRKTGDKIIRGVVPIFGFDLPAQTATTTSYVQVSRILKGYSAYFPSTAYGGTERGHQLVIRYIDKLPTATASSSQWRVSTTTGAAFHSFTVPGCGTSTDLNTGEGKAYTVELGTTTIDSAIPNTGIPTDADTPWWLEVKSQPNYPNYPIRIFQIFLIAYDQVK